MPFSKLERVLNALRAAGFAPRSRGKHWEVRCPCHDDRRPSLSISLGADGRVLMHCFAGCPPTSIVAKIGLRLRDLMPATGFTADKSPRRRRQTGISSVSDPSVPPKMFATAAAAVAELERHRGRRSAMWLYRNLQGNPVGLVVRWDGRDGKTIIPVSRFGDHWRIAGMPVPRPLYRLPDLLHARRVFITEGEKAAEAAWSIGLVATTSAHGAGSARKTDWSPLAGRECVLLPDNDATGRDYAADVLSILDALRPRCTIKIVELPGLPIGGDIADLVATRSAPS